MSSDQRLYAGQSLTSPSGALSLVMQGDGNLVLYSPGGHVRWHAGTHGNPGAWVTLQGDGNLVVYSPTGQALFHTGTNGTGVGLLNLQDDGNLVLYDGRSRAHWVNGHRLYLSRLETGERLTTGHRLRSPNGHHDLVMQPDGNLVLYGPGGVRWTSNTAESGANQLVIQHDGNLVLYTPWGAAAWNSGTASRGAGVLELQNDGNVVHYLHGGGYSWQTGTHGGSGGSGGSSPNYSDIVAVGRQLQAMGFHVSEHPAFGGVAPVHMRGSLHYSGRAIDVNWYGPGPEPIRLDELEAWIRRNVPWTELIWRAPDHYDHLHLGI